MLEKHCFGSVFSGKTSTFWYSLFNRNKKRSSAFTLTEMLIALVVVAVLAVLILPVVTTRAQNKSFAMAYDSQVKQLLNSLIGLNVYENVPQFQDTMMFQESMPANFDTSSGTYIKKYMKVAKYCGSNNPSGCFANKYYVFENNDKKQHEGFLKANGQANGNIGACALLKNGVSICLKPQIKFQDGSTADIAGWLDLNGPKGPNIFGRDLRPFRVNLNDRIAYNPEIPDVVIVPGNPEDCIGSGCVGQNECLTSPASEKCCMHGGEGGGVKTPAGINDPCCVWHMNPNPDGPDYPNYLICNPGEEPTEKSCENETITFGHRCCFNVGEGTIKDPVCCGPDDEAQLIQGDPLTKDDYCCKVKFGNSLNCCKLGIAKGTIVLTANHPCCSHSDILKDHLNECMAPCELDEKTLKELYGDNWRQKRPSVEDTDATRAHQNCCDTRERRFQISSYKNNNGVDVSGFGPEDSCCMYESVYRPDNNPISADLCCRMQIFPLQALHGRNPSDIEDICCTWRFTKKDLDNNSWLVTHNYVSGHDDNIYNDNYNTNNPNDYNFDSCCFYALGEIRKQNPSNSIWKADAMQTKVWQNCCSVGSLSLPEVTLKPNPTNTELKMREYTEHCCHFFVNNANEYGRDALLEMNNGAEGALRKYCCALDEFKDYPECCSSSEDGWQSIVGEYRDVCCMPNQFYGMKDAIAPGNAKNQTNATEPAPWCCLNAGKDIQKEGSFLFSKDAKFSGGNSRLDGCCNMGDRQVPSNIKHKNGDGDTDKSLHDTDKWQVNCCGNRWIENGQTAGQKYPSAAAFIKGCCVGSENSYNYDQWTDYKNDDVDGPLMEDCCVAYGGPDDDNRNHSRNDKRWWERCCSETKASLTIAGGAKQDYKFYYKDLGCCKNVHWWIVDDPGAPNYITDDINCCTASYDGATGTPILDKIKEKDPDPDWLANCCKYVEKYAPVGGESKGYELFVDNCCYKGDTEHDGDRLLEYGGIQDRLNGTGQIVGKHRFPDDVEPFEKRCCDVNIAEGAENKLDETTGETPEGAKIPGKKCCWHFLTDSGLTQDYNEPPKNLTTNYRGYCCKAYGNSSENPLDSSNNVTFRELATSLDNDCEALWICGGNGTDRSPMAGLQVGNAIGYGLPNCCTKSSGHNKNTNWKNGCCEFPRYYETNAIYREHCCAPESDPDYDYKRKNPGKNDGTIEQGKNNAVPYSAPDSTNQAFLNADDSNDKTINTWAFCCDPDIADGNNPKTPSINCCKWFHNIDNLYRHNNEFYTNRGPVKNDKDKALSKKYQIECCNQSLKEGNVDNDLCSTCAIRWETGITQGKTADAYTDAGWQYYNFQGCCKSVWDAENTDLVLTPGAKLNSYASRSEWLSNCCAYVGNEKTDINKYYGSHENFRTWCCNGGGGNHAPDNCYPVTADKVTIDGCCDSWAANGQLNDDLTEACCHNNKFSTDYKAQYCGPEPCTQPDITISDTSSYTNTNGKIVHTVKATASSAVTGTVKVKYVVGKKGCENGSQTTFNDREVELTINPGATESSNSFTVTIDAAGSPSGKVNSKEWIKSSKVTQVPDSDCPKYNSALSVNIAESTNDVYCGVNCATAAINETNAAACCESWYNNSGTKSAAASVCCNTWYADANKKANVKDLCCAVNGFQGNDEEKQKYCCPAEFDGSKATAVCCNKWVSDNKLLPNSTNAVQICCANDGFTWKGTASCCPAEPSTDAASAVCCAKWASDGTLSGVTSAKTKCCSDFISDDVLCCPSPTADNPSETCCNHWLSQNVFNDGNNQGALQACCSAYTNFGGSDHNKICASTACPSTPEPTDKATEQCCGEWLTNNKFNNNAYPEAKAKCCTYASFGGDNHDTLCSGGDGCAPITLENANKENCDCWWGEHKDNWRKAVWYDTTGSPDILQACCAAGAESNAEYSNECCNNCGTWLMGAIVTGESRIRGISLRLYQATKNVPSNVTLKTVGQAVIQCTFGSSTPSTHYHNFELENTAIVDTTVSTLINLEVEPVDIIEDPDGNLSLNSLPTHTSTIMNTQCQVTQLNFTVYQNDVPIAVHSGTVGAEFQGQMSGDACHMEAKTNGPDDTCTVEYPEPPSPPDPCDTLTYGNASTTCCARWRDEGKWSSLDDNTQDRCCAEYIKNADGVNANYCVCKGGLQASYELEERMTQGQQSDTGIATVRLLMDGIPTWYSASAAAKYGYMYQYASGNRWVYGDEIKQFDDIKYPGTSVTNYLSNCSTLNNCTYFDGEVYGYEIHIKNDETGADVASVSCESGRAINDNGTAQLINQCFPRGNIDIPCRWQAIHSECRNYPPESTTASEDACTCWMSESANSVSDVWGSLSDEQKETCCNFFHDTSHCKYICESDYSYSFEAMYGSSSTEIVLNSTVVRASGTDPNILILAHVNCSKANGASETKTLTFDVHGGSNVQQRQTIEGVASCTGNISLQGSNDVRNGHTLCRDIYNQCSGREANGCFWRFKASLDDSTKYAMSNDKLFAHASQKHAENKLLAQAQGTQNINNKKDKITINRKNRHMYINDIDTGIVKPTIWQTIAAKFSELRDRIAANLRTFIARTFGIQISARKLQPLGVYGGNVNAGAAQRLTAGKYHTPAANTLQGSAVWADDETVGEEPGRNNDDAVNLKKDGLRDSKFNRLSPAHCCNPTHPKPSKYCCEKFAENNKWQDFEVGTKEKPKEPNYLSLDYKTYCCKEHGICPTVTECKPEYENSENPAQRKIFEDCLALFNTGDPSKWAATGEKSNSACCPCLYQKALHTQGVTTDSTKSSWAKMCCPVAAGQNTRETDVENGNNKTQTEILTGLQPGEFKSVCCPADDKAQNGSLKEGITGANDERCCNYVNDSNNSAAFTSSSYCCEQYSKKPENTALWNNRLTTINDENADGTGNNESQTFRYYCCRASWNSDDLKYCSCNQIYNMVTDSEPSVSGPKVKTKFEKIGMLSQCCGNLYNKDTNNKPYHHKGGGKWMGACCQDARTHGDTVFANRNTSTTDVNKAFRDICCVNARNGNVQVTSSDDEKYKDERCCNFKSASSASSFCCKAKAAGGVTASSDNEDDWTYGEGTAWIITGTGNTGNAENQETSMEFRQACCTGYTDDEGKKVYAGNDQFCTCDQLYNKYKDETDTSKAAFDLFSSFDGDKDKRVTCCSDLRNNFGTGEIWKKTCCPVFKLYSTEGSKIFGVSSSEVNTTFRNTCCISGGSGCFYKNGGYSNKSCAADDPDDTVTSSKVKDWRCCTGNSETDYSGSMPSNNTGKKGSGNYFCCSNLTPDTTTTYGGHSENARAVGCCKTGSGNEDEGVRWGGGKDPQCCSYKARTVDVNTHDGRTSVNEYCCTQRQAGINTDEGAEKWTATNGTIVTSGNDRDANFRAACCRNFEAVGKDICTCDYYYTNGKWNLLKQSDVCCTAMFKYDKNDADLNYTGATSAKNADGTMKENWKINCCVKSFDTVGDNYKSAWRDACCSYNPESGENTLRNDEDTYGCCEWRWGKNVFDRTAKSYVDTDTADMCCGSWYDTHAENDEDEDKFNQHCCHKDSETTGCCEYMYYDTRNDATLRKSIFYPGSPCCTNNPNMADKPECLDFCQRFSAEKDDGTALYDKFYYVSTDENDVTSGKEYLFNYGGNDSDIKNYINEQKRYCCTEFFKPSGGEYGYLGDSQLVQNRCCTVPTEDDSKFVVENEVCCDHRKVPDEYGGPDIFFYTPEAFARKTCDRNENNDCSAYKIGDFYCGIPCSDSPDADSVSPACCDLWIQNGTWGAEGSDYTVEDACCQAYQDVHEGKCRQVCSITNQEEVWADVQVSIDVSENLGQESKSTCRYTLNVKENDRNTIKTSRIWAHLGKLTCEGFTYGGQYGLNINESGNSNSVDVSACYTPASGLNSSVYGCPNISGMEIYEPSLGQLSCGPGTYNVNCKRYGGLFVDSECTDWVAVRPACFEYRNSSASLYSCGCWMNNKALWNKMVDDSDDRAKTCCQNYNLAGPAACSVSWDQDFEYYVLAEWRPETPNGFPFILSYYIISYNGEKASFDVSVDAYCAQSSGGALNLTNQPFYWHLSSDDGNTNHEGTFTSWSNCQTLKLRAYGYDLGGDYERPLHSGSNSCRGYIQSGPNYEPKKYTSSDASDGSVRYAMKNTIDKLFAKIRSIFAMIFFPNNVTGEAK